MDLHIKYSIGDIVYFPVFSKADLIKASVVSIIPAASGCRYRVRFTRAYMDDTDLVASESELMSFAEGKIALLQWLNAKISSVNSMVED